jgi:hypothetical protein
MTTHQYTPTDRLLQRPAQNAVEADGRKCCTSSAIMQISPVMCVPARTANPQFLAESLFTRAYFLPFSSTNLGLGEPVTFIDILPKPLWMRVGGIGTQGYAYVTYHLNPFPSFSFVWC